MGKYINVTVAGRPIGPSYISKCSAMLSMGAEEISEPNEWEEGLVCCVKNGPIGALAFADSEEEMIVFKQTEPREKKWFLLKEARELAK